MTQRTEQQPTTPIERAAVRFLDALPSLIDPIAREHGVSTIQLRICLARWLAQMTPSDWLNALKVPPQIRDREGGEQR